MDDAKATRLRRHGWVVGGAEEFLALCPAESAFIEVRLSLAELLREKRLADGLTQLQAAQLLGSSQSRVAKMEAADPGVSIDLLVRAILALGASTQELGRAIEKVA